MSRPDLVIILTDEERAAPAYENDEIRAWRDEHLPGRKWFTDNGVDFERHYVAATACVPSRPSLLTGQYPFRHGWTQDSASPSKFFAADEKRLCPRCTAVCRGAPNHRAVTAFNRR